MTNWETNPLGELVKSGGGKIHTGPFGSQLHASDYVSSGIPCIMPANMKNNRVDLSGIAYISEQDAERLSKYIVLTGDIVYSRRGDVTLKALIREDEDGYFCGTGCLLLRPGNEIDSEFLAYYLSMPALKEWIIKQAVGATMPNLNTGILERIPFKGPNKTEQREVASVIVSIDSKIELNNKINAELEAMVKLIYDYWFVQFDFPAANGKPYKSSGGKMVYNEALKREIPYGWVVDSLLDSCDVVDCLHSKKPDSCFEDESCYLLQLENILNNGQLDVSSKYYVSKSDYADWTSRIEIREHDVVMTNAGRIAAFAQVPKGVVCGIGRNITAIRPNSINPNYFFLSIAGIDIQRQILSSLDQGAFFKSFNVKGIKRLKLLRAINGLEESFDEVVSPMVKKRHQLIEENTALTRLRDWLLPMLMNGQVTVRGL